MITNHAAPGTRLIIRSFFWVSLVILIILANPPAAFAEDGDIYVGGKKLDTLYRYKRGVKYFPLEKVSTSLGLKVSKDGRYWVVHDTYCGEIKLGGRNDSNIIERDGITFAPEDFWRDTLGFEVIEKQSSVYIYNRIVEVRVFKDGLLVTTAAPVDFTSFVLDDPPRTVYDFKNLSIGNVTPEVKYEFNDLPFHSVRIGQFESFPHTGRVVVDHSGQPQYKPVSGIHGPLKNNFWVGNSEYSYPVDSEPEPEKFEKESEKQHLLFFGDDGTIRFRGVKFSKVTMVNLWDTFPFRTYFDLYDCTLPFKDEKTYLGSGQILRVRLAQNEDNVARLVVELVDQINLEPQIISNEELAIGIKRFEMKKNFLVLIDPGHGGLDPGAIVTAKEMGINLSAMEKDINLKLSFALGKILTERGITVKYTRTDDRFVSLEDRRDMAIRLGADLFVSVHTNATPHRPQCFVRGPEVYYHYKRDAKLAREVWNHMSWRTGVRGRGTFFCRFLVTMNPRIPSILVECAYLNNVEDLKALLDPRGEYAHQAMLGIADGITAVFGVSKTQTIQPEKKKEPAPTLDTRKNQYKVGRRQIRFGLDDYEPPEQMSRNDSDRDRYKNIFSYTDSESDTEITQDSTEEQAQEEPKESEELQESQVPEESEESENLLEGNEESIILQKINLEIQDDIDRQEELEEWDKEELKEKRKNIFSLEG